jgi:hypothetical protein
MAVIIPNGHKTNQYFPFQTLPKYSQIGMQMYVPSGNPAISSVA